MSADEPAHRLEHFRHRTLRELEYQLRQGRLGRDEYDRRVSLARRATSPGDLRTLIVDLAAATDRAAVAASPAPETSLAVPEAPAAPAEPAGGAASQSATTAPWRNEPESELVFAVLSGSMRTGAWHPPEHVNAFALMGGVKLDFRDAVLAHDVTRVHAWTLMGGITILVPPDVHVTVRGVGLMGGFGRTRRAPVAPPAAPRIHVDGLALMGGVDVKVRNRGAHDDD